MPRPTTPHDIGRRDFARIADRDPWRRHPGRPRGGNRADDGPEGGARHQAVRAVVGQAHRRAAALPQADRRRVRQRRLDPGPAHRRGLHADQEALRGRRHHRLEHRQHRRPQHARGHAQPPRPRPEDRGVQAVPPQPRRRPASATRPTRTWATASGAAAAPRSAARRPASSTWPAPTSARHWDGKICAEPLSHGREFTKEEIWENYTHFIKQVAPVAEEAGVRIGIHPDDPPVPGAGRRARAASSATSRATSGRWRSPTARTSASACAAAPGSKAARSSPARTPRR